VYISSPSDDSSQQSLLPPDYPSLAEAENGNLPILTSYPKLSCFCFCQADRATPDHSMCNLAPVACSMDADFYPRSVRPQEYLLGSKVRQPRASNNISDCVDVCFAGPAIFVYLNVPRSTFILCLPDPTPGNMAFAHRTRSISPQSWNGSPFESYRSRERLFQFFRVFPASVVDLGFDAALSNDFSNPFGELLRPRLESSLALAR